MMNRGAQQPQQAQEPSQQQIRQSSTISPQEMHRKARVASIEGDATTMQVPSSASNSGASAAQQAAQRAEDVIMSVGIQFEEIRKFSGSQVKARICILDDADTKRVVDQSSTFATELADPGIEEKDFGWSGMAMNHVFKDLIASTTKRGLIEVFDGSIVVARTDVQLFTGSRRRGLNINEGFHRLKLYRAAGMLLR